MKECYCNGVPPPFEALDRINPYSQFSVKKGLEINSCKAVGENVLLETNQGLLEYDFLILATGFALDGSCQPELRSFFSDVMLWKDKYNVSSRFGNSPYLGTHFQFIEKPGRSLPYLKHIYCFNYAATLSHGLLSSDIPGIGIGAARLARGIASDLFNDGFEEYYDRLKNYNIK